MSRMNRKIVLAFAASFAIAPLISDAVRGDDAEIDSATALVPIEPDEAPVRPEIPRPTTHPMVHVTTAPTTGPTTAPSEEAAEAADPVSRFVDHLKQPLTDRGITPALSLTADLAKNLRGGASTNGSSFSHLLSFSLSADM